MQPDRRPRYASPDGLGQAFNFDLLEANWNAADFRAIISDNLTGTHQQRSSSTWVLSNHDVVRHATRYGLPPGQGGHSQDGKAWLLSNGAVPELDRDLGLRRARAATLLMLALPGSAYLYQGEELGLHEVGDIPAELIQDPTFQRSGRVEKGRDGCRSAVAVDTGRSFLRIRERWGAPAAASVVRSPQRRGAAGGSRLHPELLSAGAQLAAQAGRVRCTRHRRQSRQGRYERQRRLRG